MRSSSVGAWRRTKHQKNKKGSNPLFEAIRRTPKTEELGVLKLIDIFTRRRRYLGDSQGEGVLDLDARDNKGLTLLYLSLRKFLRATAPAAPSRS